MKARLEEVSKKKIQELVEKIATAASFIDTANPDNINTVSTKDFYKDEITEFAEKMIKEYDIQLYCCPHSAYAEAIEKLVSAENEKEFIDALEQYAEAMYEWAKAEEESELLLLDYYDLKHIREVTELTEQEEIYWNERVTIFREKRKLFTKEFELYVAEIDIPPHFSILKIDTDICSVIKNIDELIEEYNNNKISSYELYERITDLISKE